MGCLIGLSLLESIKMKFKKLSLGGKLRTAAPRDIYQQLERWVAAEAALKRASSECDSGSEKETNVEYHSEYSHKSWALPESPATPGRTVTYGFWVRETTDRIIEPKLRGGPRKDAYRPLQEGTIRVFRLSPGSPEDPLQGQLESVFLGSDGCSQEYEALSYCWGSWNPSLESGTVTVPALEGPSTVLQVNQNLEMALRNLRLRSGTRTLWIDALCINQYDLTERAEQVKKMLDIYAAANGVYARLGPSTEQTAAGFMLLEGMKARDSSDVEASWTSLPPDLVEPALRDV